jgi:hypothetical protein
MLDKHKTKIIILAVTGILFVLSAVYASYQLGMRKGSHSGELGLSSDPNAVMIDQDYLATLQGYNSITAEQGQFIHHAFTDLYFKADSLIQECPAWCDPANHYNMFVSMRLVGSDELLFTTGTIAPGQMLSSITLNHTLEPGLYQATMTYTPVDDRGNAYGSLTTDVVVHVE